METEMDRKAHRASDRYILRLPDGMRDNIKQAAATNRRSMNAEFIFLIEKGLEQTEEAKKENAPTAANS